MLKVFVDGQEGTTGLQIRDRLSQISSIEVLEIEQELRKSNERKAELLNAADVVFLCLPDDAAKESVALVKNSNTIIIDTSTAHRTNPSWAYGLPELSPAHLSAIKNSKRIANPGCHSTGFLLAVYPLVAKNIISKDADLACYSLTGYSGGGKKMIAEYEAYKTEGREVAPKPYALSLQHKHLPEMQKIAGLSKPPLFNPIVASYYQGMAVSVGLFKEQLKLGSFDKLRDFLAEYYSGQEFVKVMPETPSMLDPKQCNGTNEARIFVCGREEHGQITVVLDNLGKGASGAAVQSLKILQDKH